MFRMSSDSHQRDQTPLGDLLPPKVKTVLEKGGIRTVEEVRKAYPHELLKIRGVGMFIFRQIEAVFFPKKSFEPQRVRSPLRHVRGSSLNGTLCPATVQTLARGGITTADQLRATEPNDLLKLERFGIGMLREIERVFFPGQNYQVPRGRRSAPKLPDL